MGPPRGAKVGGVGERRVPFTPEAPQALATRLGCNAPVALGVTLRAAL